MAKLICAKHKRDVKIKRRKIYPWGRWWKYEWEDYCPECERLIKEENDG
jgi:hypothetical protein